MWHSTSRSRTCWVILLTAYSTEGIDLDSDHKQIHLSLNYINNITKSRKADEILGVLVHETVHAYQWNAQGTCPGGLIEGIADFVRLNSNLDPPHWKRDPKSVKWDAGYQHTAYFLEYLETRFGIGTIRKMNEKLRTRRYEEKPFWTELLGRPVEQLWGDYTKAVEAEKSSKLPPGEERTSAEDEELVMVEREDADSSERKSGEAEDIRPTPTRVSKDNAESSSPYDGSSPPAGVV